VSRLEEKIIGHALDGSFLGNPENLESVLLGINDGVYLVDRDRRIVFWNCACEEITGYAAGEVLGRPCSDNILKHTDRQGNSLCESELCPLYRSMLTGAAGEEPLTVLALKKDGSRLAVEVSVAPLRGEGGEIVGGVEVFRDVTRKNELEEARASFLSGVTHELKTPLTVIRGNLEMILEGDTGEINPTQRSFLSDNLEEAKRLEKLINDLLDLARYETVEFSIEYQAVDLDKVLERVARNFLDEAERKGLEIELRLSHIRMFGDPDRLYQAFANLLSNAVKYTEAGGISVEAAAKKGWAVVRVKDSGVGIDEGELPRIFEPFYRAHDGGKRAGEGSGMGLAIVRRIVDSHGGKLKVESKRGEGSLFTVYLPLTPLDRTIPPEEEKGS